MERCCLDCPLVLFTLGFQTRLAKATTKKRYSDTTIHGAGAGAGAMHKLCKLLPSITMGDISKNIFRGGAYTQKYFL